MVDTGHVTCKPSISLVKQVQLLIHEIVDTLHVTCKIGATLDSSMVDTLHASCKTGTHLDSSNTLQDTLHATSATNPVGASRGIQHKQ